MTLHKKFTFLQTVFIIKIKNNWNSEESERICARHLEESYMLYISYIKDYKGLLLFLTSLGYSLKNEKQQKALQTETQATNMHNNGTCKLHISRRFIK
jgi:hypothetical protein